MEKKRKNLTDFVKNKENPFIEKTALVINENKVKKFKTGSGSDKKAILQAVNDEGEVVGYTRFLRQVEVDEERFTKLFLSNFSAFFDLKASAIKVFGYIMTKLQPNKDQFIFLMEECMEHTGYKNHRSVNEGLKELLSSEIIARGSRDVFYYINPTVAFNGSRVAFATEFIKKNEEKKNEEKKNEDKKHKN